MAKKFWYVVRKGLVPGIYMTWDECKANVEGVSGSEFKKFETEVEALRYLHGMRPPELDDDSELLSSPPIHTDGGLHIYVDGSCNPDTLQYSYGAVVVWDGTVSTYKEMFDDEYSPMRNVAGEVRGAIFAMNYCRNVGEKRVTIYHDYTGISDWANGYWKANTAFTREYKQIVATMLRDGFEINFVKIKSHSGDKYNDLADKMAKAALGFA